MKPRYYQVTSVSFLRAAYLCALAVLAPARLAELNDADAKILAPTLDGAISEPSAFVIRRAFWSSLVSVLASVLAGFLVGRVVSSVLGCAPLAAILVLGSAGAGILLWGTLYVRGWQVQTFKGLSLNERVNAWLFRGMYCIGTAVVVWSISWPQCKT